MTFMSMSSWRSAGSLFVSHRELIQRPSYRQLARLLPIKLGSGHLNSPNATRIIAQRHAAQSPRSRPIPTNDSSGCRVAYYHSNSEPKTAMDDIVPAASSSTSPPIVQQPPFVQPPINTSLKLKKRKIDRSSVRRCPLSR